MEFCTGLAWVTTLKMSATAIRRQDVPPTKPENYSNPGFAAATKKRSSRLVMLRRGRLLICPRGAPGMPRHLAWLHDRCCLPRKCLGIIEKVRQRRVR
jgi:hypothetical protein